MARGAQPMGLQMGGLISPEYARLNAELHTSEPEYGIGGSQWGFDVLDILERHGLKSVLDYGCGKGELARFLRDRHVLEYDPAIEGKAHAGHADLVVCTDVLEHIEPGCLDAVLAHLKDCTDRRLFFNIATRPALKVLADGRNAHLLVKSPDWWRERLQEHFVIERWEVSPGSVLGEAIPLREIGKINNSMAVADDERNEYVRINCDRTPNRLKIDVPAHDRTAVLVCYGPSLLDTWPEISLARFQEGQDIFTVSAAHAFMLERGIVPVAHLDCDPREHKVAQIGEPHQDVKYWLASCVHPSWLDKVPNAELWHSYNGQASTVAFDIDPGHRMVIGGGSIGLRAISVLYCRGYRKFEIHGMDCSNRGETIYAGPHLGKEKSSLRVRCGDRWFNTSPVLILYARYFFKQIDMLPDADIRLHGDGLLQTMVKGATT